MLLLSKLDLNNFNFIFKKIIIKNYYKKIIIKIDNNFYFYKNYYKQALNLCPLSATNNNYVLKNI